MQEIARRDTLPTGREDAPLIDWIRENLCPDLPPFGKRPKGPPPKWNDRRVLIFTENREGTKRYLKTILEQAIDGTEHAEERIEVIDGLTSGSSRKEIQRRFNTDPTKDPLRILLATDAAREGLNFQAHCTDLFHFDLPWNPGPHRATQRPHRPQASARDEGPLPLLRPASAHRGPVLEVLVRKTETIKEELGSLSKVIDDDIERRSRAAFATRRRTICTRNRSRPTSMPNASAYSEELEAARERQEDLKAQIERCQTLLEAPAIGLASSPRRSAMRFPARWSSWVPSHSSETR